MKRLYQIEFAVSCLFVAILHRIRSRYEPDWTWLTVVAGTIISTAPAMLAARRHPADWRSYERRMITGFVISGSVVIPWQILLVVRRWRQQRGYVLAKDATHGDATAPLARQRG